MTKQIGVLGCGWLGLPLAVALLGNGYSVKGSTTSEEKLAELQAKHIRPYLISLSENSISGDIEGFLRNVELLIINIPPKLRGNQRENFVKKMHLLHTEIVQSAIKQVLFVCSTSVYGDIQGEVTETTTPLPSTESGRQLLAAEAIFRTSKALQTTIVRFGGLIGSDRHPVKMLSGRKSLAKGNHPINLIHRLDCIQIIEFILKENWWGKIVNGVYPYHPTKQAYYTSEALKNNIQPPEYQENNNALGKKVVPKSLLDVKIFRFTTPICK